MIAGKDAFTPGEAKNSWLSGTSAWCMYVISQHILGISPGYDGLTVNPCIPAEWKGYKIIRRFRESIYNIEVLNPDHKSKGIKEVLIDGKQHSSNILPLFPAGTEHSIKVTLG
jgi:cellobiose phosphorylase